MAQPPRTKIPVRIELGRDLAAVADGAAGSPFRRRLEFQLFGFCERLGIPGDPEVSLEKTDGVRAIRIRVHDAYLLYSPEFLSRAWWAVFPSKFSGDAFALLKSAPRFPDAAVLERLNALIRSESVDDRNMALGFVEHLAHEVIRCQPACLVDRAIAEIYLAEVDPRPAGTAMLDSVYSILRDVLNRWVSTANRREVVSLIRAAKDQGQSDEDVAQKLFSRLRVGAVEIHVHPGYLEALTDMKWPAPKAVFADDGNESIHENFRLMLEGMFYELGIRAPRLVWVPDPQMVEGTIAVKINDYLAPPRLGLQPNQIMVDQTASILMSEMRQDAQPQAGSMNDKSAVPAENFMPYPMAHPVNSRECAAVPKAALGNVIQGRNATWTPMEHLAMSVYADLAASIDRLISCEDVEYELSRLSDTLPELVATVLQRFSPEMLAHILQGLVREGISIRDLRSILERLLLYDWIEIDAKSNIVLDDRLPVPPGAKHISHWSNYLKFVRNGLQQYITNKYSLGSYTMSVHLLSRGLEQRLEAIEYGIDEVLRLDKTEEQTLRDVIWKELGNNYRDHPGPIILTTSGARSRLRELVSGELPRLRMLAYSELTYESSLHPLSRISI